MTTSRSKMLLPRNLHLPALALPPSEDLYETSQVPPTREGGEEAFTAALCPSPGRSFPPPPPTRVLIQRAFTHSLPSSQFGISVETVFLSPQICLLVLRLLIERMGVSEGKGGIQKARLL